MIREITEADIPILVAYGSHFWTLTPYVSTGMEYNEEAIEELLYKMKDGHYLRVYEVEGEIVGFIGILLLPMIFNPRYIVGQELFFYVHPLNRGTVGKALMQKAEEDLKQFVDLLAFGELRSSKDMNEYYSNLGFVHSETTFVKVI